MSDTIKQNHPTTSPSQTHHGTLLWSLLLILIFTISLGASWMTLKTVDFGYPLLHSLLNIDAKIKQHAPNNKYRKAFEKTDAAEQKRLFHEIVLAIHGDIAQLEKLTYSAPDGTALGTFLRKPEIIHLQDVKVLIDRFIWLCLLLTPIAVGLLWYLYQKKVSFPGMRKIMKHLSIALAATSALVLILGPTTVFYQLHIWLFPAENQWFFYYDESLMTTLMIAPVIFGPIAVFLVLLTLPYTLGLLYGCKKLCAR